MALSSKEGQPAPCPGTWKRREVVQRALQDHGGKPGGRRVALGVKSHEGQGRCLMIIAETEECGDLTVALLPAQQEAVGSS